MKYTAFAILMVIGIKFAITESARLLLLYHQHKCLTYAPPPDQIAYTTIPSVIAEYSSKPAYLAVGAAAIRTRPTDWDWFAGHCVAPYPIPCRPNDAILFMHERTSPGGNRRLIAIERIADIHEPPYFINGFDVETYLMEPGGMRNTPRRIFTGNEVDVLYNNAPHSDVSIYAGQIDPSDASHFTIRFESEGKTRIVDGHLRDDDQVTLTAPR